MSMQHWWNDNDGGNQSSGRTTCPSATSSTTNLICTALGLNPNLDGKRPTTNHLTHSIVGSISDH